MVYFTCGTCGEQIKKPNVEKHYTQKCRNCEVLTCIDCLKDFYGDEYKAHNQCMSEDQRYSKEGRNGYDPTVGQNNKGDKKQQAWIGKLRGLLETTDNIDSDVRGICDVILNHENIPRKKPKFLNFVKNIMRQKVQPSSIEKTWDLFAQALVPSKEDVKPAENGSTTPAAENSAAEATKKEKKNKKKTKNKEEEEEEEKQTSLPNRDLEEEAEKTKKKSKKKNKKNKYQSTEEEELKMEEEEEAEAKMETEEEEGGKENVNSNKKKDKKRKRTEAEDDEEDGEPEGKRSKFDWDEVITALLRQKTEMKVNKLKKRCLAEFMAAHPATHRTQEQLGAKFDKKIAKKKYRLLKDKVRLAHPEEAEEAATEANQEMEVQQQQQEKEAAEKISFNKWEATSFGSEAQTEKFRRLMGIKTSKPPEAIAAQKRDDKKIFRDLEQGFEKARQSHFSAKGRGLGFSQ